MSNTAILVLFAFGTGALIPLQLAFNAQLGGVTGSAFSAGLVVFVVGAAAMLISVAVMRSPLPAMDKLATAPPTIWLGGLIAALYILAVVIVTPRLGVGTTAVLVIAGQIMMALLLDHLGAFGNPQHALNWQRLAGGALVLAGVYAIRTN